jgi:hypothetical protein
VSFAGLSDEAGELLARVRRIRHASAGRAESRALGRIMETDALSALGRIDHEGRIPLRDGGVGALRLANTAVDAIVCDFIGHGKKSPSEKSQGLNPPSRERSGFFPAEF